MRTCQICAHAHTLLKISRAIAAASAEHAEMLRERMILLLLLLFVQLSSVVSRARVESFPSCVEITRVQPYPHSVVNMDENAKVMFVLTFSKPVFLRHNGRRRVFLSTSPRGIYLGTYSNNVRVRTRQQTAEKIVTTSTSRLQWGIIFTLSDTYTYYFGKLFK